MARNTSNDGANSNNSPLSPVIKEIEFAKRNIKGEILEQLNNVKIFTESAVSAITSDDDKQAAYALEYMALCTSCAAEYLDVLTTEKAQGS